MVSGGGKSNFRHGSVFEYLIDSSGTLWAADFNGTPPDYILARSSDGYTWTYFDSSTAPFIALMHRSPVIDTNGNIAVWTCPENKYGDYGMRCGQAIKWRFDDNAWHAVDTIRLPSDTFFFYHVFEDRRGDTWVPDYSGGMLRYTGDTVIRYDTSEVPSHYIHFSGEDPRGDLYAYTEKGVYRFTRSPSSADRPAFRRGAVFHGDPGVLTFDRNHCFRFQCTLSRCGRVTVGMFTLKGEFIGSLIDEYRSPGSFRATGTLRRSPGVGIIRISTPDGIGAKKLMPR